MSTNSIIPVVLAVSVIFGSSHYNGSTLAPVVLAGAILQSKSVVDIKKYKRKDCPVCEGKGWYMSGDGIKKVDCGYCEPDTKSVPLYKDPPPPPSVLKQSQPCPDGQCLPKSQIFRR